MARLQGIAIPYFSKSENIGWIETIESGAIDLQQSGDVLAVYYHKEENLLARTSSGTLKLTEKPEGLYFEIELPDTTLANDLTELIQRGDLKGVSFNMTVLADRFDFTTEPPNRVIQHAVISEISIVPKPAYSATYVEVVQ
ncbi:HK97 family phage prohead protease [Photobacterium rosenbergii]|uniref:HK97 family phage prohead protease n=1 Tax=Photobacterium rosenbergii TaxID=294936 RepID=A0A2T3MYL9_9GAMM|nr:HK97 family phage prohead protease [Photobacterium rosenbergii]PSW05045.1 HK97 family phage prohead protease [Photobacterium rosenbergii]